MKALFITTEPNDVTNVIKAWDCWNNVSSERITFDYLKPIDGEGLVKAAKESSPDVIFYIGAGAGCYTPGIPILKAFRTIAPSINICFDAVEVSWHALLENYRRNECFDLQVSIDGNDAPGIDLVTLAPVVATMFEGDGPERNIRCGLSGNMGHGIRARIVNPLVEEGLIEFRFRDVVNGYEDHVNFMRRCEVIFNTSFSGSGKCHQVKQRVSEAAFAGCALLDMAAAPTRKWYPQEYVYVYRGVSEARNIIKNFDLMEVRERGNALREYAKLHYHPSIIFGEMLQLAKVAT